MAKKKTFWKEIGIVGVDSGLLMLVDPCYVLPSKDDDEPINTNYDKLLTLLGHEPKVIKNVNFSGVAGDGVVFSTAYGDGAYPILGKFEIQEDGFELLIEIRVKLQ